MTVANLFITNKENHNEKYLMKNDYFKISNNSIFICKDIKNIVIKKIKDESEVLDLVYIKESASIVRSYKTIIIDIDNIAALNHETKTLTPHVNNLIITYLALKYIDGTLEMFYIEERD